MTVWEAEVARVWSARIVGAALCLAVAVIHVIDQGGIPGDKEPGYVGVGYWILEVVAVVAAVLLVAGRPLVGWFLAVGVAVGPLAGYLLSRGPGLPAYDDDRGNWTEPIGVVSLLVEGVLLVVAAVLLLRRIRRPATSAEATGRA